MLLFPEIHLNTIRDQRRWFYFDCCQEDQNKFLVTASVFVEQLVIPNEEWNISKLELWERIRTNNNSMDKLKLEYI